MKNIITIAVLLIAVSTTYAQTNTTAATEKKTAETTKTVEVKDTKATATPSTNDATAKYDDDSSQFVGTNDFNLVLIREGIKKG